MAVSSHELGLSPSLPRQHTHTLVSARVCPEVVWPLVEHLEINQRPLAPWAWSSLPWVGEAFPDTSLLCPHPSCSAQTMLLEKLRVARRPASEATFNVFYYLLACGDGTLR